MLAITDGGSNAHSPEKGVAARRRHHRVADPRTDVKAALGSSRIGNHVAGRPPYPSESAPP